MSWYRPQVSSVEVGRTVLSALAMTFWIALPSQGASPDASAAPEWPPLRAGMWEVEYKRTLKGGKMEAWKEVISMCTDPAEMVRGYWGQGIVEEAGCRYDVARTAADEFKVSGECMVRRAGVSKSEAIVRIRGGDDFEMTVKVVEGKKVYRGSQIGHRRSDCVNGKSKP